MGEYRRLASLVLIMIGVCLIVGATAIGVIYEAALDRERARLVNIAQSQARLMEALAHLEAPARTEGEQPSAGALWQILEANRLLREQGIGQTAEVQLARREGDLIVFVTPARGSEQPHEPVAFGGPVADPMTAALSGRSGAMIGRDYAGRWAERRASMPAAVFVPLWFAPGEAYQFDFSHEVVVLGGVTTTVKVAHLRLCHSRMRPVVAYPRETQEMVFDAHDRAFRLFGGACQRGIYDNMSTAVETVFIGKKREFNRRFLQMCSHYLVEPTACTPTAGWEKGQVENQVGNTREQLFTPRLRFQTLPELNGWLADRCIADAKTTTHPEIKDRTIWEVFEAERRALIGYPGAFDGFHETEVSVSKTSLVRFDRNRYSVANKAVGQTVQVHAYADRILIRLGGEVVAEHPRQFGRDQVIYNPWHYLPVLTRKPGALRNGAPFRDWELPPGLDQLRRRLASRDDGGRQFVDVLAAVSGDTTN